VDEIGEEMKIEVCPICAKMPDFMQFPFNKFWKGSCFTCGLSGESFKKKSDANKSWNEAAIKYRGDESEES